MQTHTFLDGFYMSRIGIRILIGHYLALQVKMLVLILLRASQACRPRANRVARARCAHVHGTVSSAKQADLNRKQSGNRRGVV